MRSLISKTVCAVILVPILVMALPAFAGGYYGDPSWWSPGPSWGPPEYLSGRYRRGHVVPADAARLSLYVRPRKSGLRILDLRTAKISSRAKVQRKETTKPLNGASATILRLAP